MNKYDLEERLIDFSVSMIEIVRILSKSEIASYLGHQLMKSGTSVSLNYAEAQSAESRKDFIHKIKIVLKELSETNVNLKIIQRAGFNLNMQLIEEGKKECNELISIMVKSIETAQKNLLAKSS